jgi:hypothetical protein
MTAQALTAVAELAAGTGVADVDAAAVFRKRLEGWQARMQSALSQRLPSPEGVPQRLHAAMRYSVLGGGKRVRPVLLFATAAALGLREEQVEGVACAVELIHAYSLVHDDLPAMDDDDLRRGRPTCHRAFDEATAILVGDALQPLAFEILACDSTLPNSSGVRLQLIATLSEASGSLGMAGGQAIDLQAQGQQLDLPEDRRIDSRQRAHGGGLRALARSAPEVRAIDLCQRDRFGVPNPGRLTGRHRRSGGAGQGGRRRSGACEADLSGIDRHCRVARARAPIACECHHRARALRCQGPAAAIVRGLAAGA